MNDGGRVRCATAVVVERGCRGAREACCVAEDAAVRTKKIGVAAAA